MPPSDIISSWLVSKRKAKSRKLPFRLNIQKQNKFSELNVNNRHSSHTSVDRGAHLEKDGKEEDRIVFIGGHLYP